MSPKRRFLAALFGGRVDRVPVGNVVSVVTTELMEAADVWFPEAHLDAGLMAELAAAGHTMLGYDTVMPVFSVTQEAAAFGCAVSWGTQEMMPYVERQPFAGASSFKLPSRWMEAGSIQVVLAALHLLRRQFGHEVVVVGKAMGPWSLSYHLMGMEEFLISTKTEPERARRCIEALKEITISFARAQFQAGADIVCIPDHISGGIVSPIMYRDMLLPVHQEITARVGGPTVLHCCGNTADRIQYFARAGFDCFHLEAQVELKHALAEAGRYMRLMGNISTRELMSAGNVRNVEAACHQTLDGGIPILSPECAVALTTPNQNLRALVDVAEARRSSAKESLASG